MPSKVPTFTSQIRALGELQDSSMNARSAMPPPPSNKHKPSGCKLPQPPLRDPDAPLTLSVPEPATKQRRTLSDRATDYDKKPAAPLNTRPAPAGVKGTVARGFAASTSRIGQNKNTRPAHAASVSGGSTNTAARVPSGNARPKSAFGHGRSKSHTQGTRPATSLKQRESDYDDEIDDDLERKGVHTFPTHTIPTIPKETLNVQKNAPPSLKKRPNSLSVHPKRAFHLSNSRSVSSPSNFRPITPVMEEPSDDTCDDICNTLDALELGGSKAVHRDSRVGRGTIPGKEPNPFLKPLPSHIPRATPARQQATPTPARPPSTTPRNQPRFINRFTNDRCPDFYDDRVEAIERDFRAFREQMLGDMQKTTNYKETIQQLQTRGPCQRSDILASMTNRICSHRTRDHSLTVRIGQQGTGVRPEGHAELLHDGEDGARDDTTQSHVRDRRSSPEAP
jgi:kinesin family protein C1